MRTPPFVPRTGRHGAPVLLALLAVGAASAAPAVGAPAATTPAAAAGTAAASGVTVLLASAAPAAYDALAQAHGVAADRRSALLATLAPTTATRAAAAAALTAAGLRVDGGTTWSLHATGPGRAVGALLGARPAARLGGAVPPSLVGVARGLIGDGALAAATRPLAVGLQNGGTLRSLYAEPWVRPLANRSPLTIATLQFSGWDASALTTFAQAQHLPLAAGQYTGVSVAGGSVSTPDGSLGDLEVALDQETLLSVAPYARQRAYVVGNFDWVTGLERVASDAARPGNPYRLAALSISWGMCETDPTLLPSDVTAIHAALADVLAAGVTVFAASGDDGRYCPATPSMARAIGVTYPAADPLIVAVGGTTVTGTRTELAWAGSGGGVSALFARPAYQAGLRTAGRALPDLAADADESSGVSVYLAGTPAPYQMGGTSLSSPVTAGLFTNTLMAVGAAAGIGDIHAALYTAAAGSFRDITAPASAGAGPGFDLVTGLGTPLWSRLLTAYDRVPRIVATPAWSGSRTVPVSVAAPTGVMYDRWWAGVGRVGEPSGCPATGGWGDPGTVRSVTAPSDGVLPLWVVARTPAVGATPARCSVAETLVLVDTVPPRATVSAALVDPRGTTARATWAGIDPLGIARYHLRLTRAGATVPVLDRDTTAPSYAWSGAPGATYTVTVTAVDRGNHSSAPVSARVVVPIDDRLLATRGFVRVGDGSAFLGAYRTASVPSAWVGGSVTGRTYIGWFTAGPTGGLARVYLDGVLVKVINLYAPAVRTRLPVVLAVRGTSAARTVVVRPAGVRPAGSRGTAVGVDALIGVA